MARDSSGAVTSRGEAEPGRLDQFSTPAQRASSLDWLQTFGAVAGVAITFATADTPVIRATIALAVCAAALGCVLLRHALTHRPWTARRRALLAAQVAVPLAMIAAAAVISPGAADRGTGRAAGGRPSQPNSPSPAEPTPVMTRTGYTLTPSSFIDTNDQDKLDLDTGCPGWGSMHPRLGPSRCGELADLIVDEEGVHSPDGGGRFVPAPAGSPTTYRVCHDLLEAEPTQNVNQIGAADLTPGLDICVETEQRNIAVVHLQRVSMNAADKLGALTIGFVMWHQKS